MTLTNNISSIKRCPWVCGIGAVEELYIQYHDEEWGVPIHDDRLLFEFLILEGVQAGLSWITILKKRDNYRKAYDNFDPHKIAYYSVKKQEELLQNKGMCAGHGVR
ncbi:MAG: DNA-3-methyladenine glycosylase I, partial [Olleya sp.]